MTQSPKASVADKPLTSVMEDYLEAIFDINQQKKIVRVKDIAKRMDVKMPSVSSMLKTLSDRGLVHYEKYEYIELTKSGKRIGKDMRHKHEVLDQFLTEVLKIDAETANEEACKMEHALSTETLDSLVDFMEFIQACPRAGNNWLDHFDEFRKQGADPEKCLMRADDFSCSYRKEAAAPKDVDSKKTGHIKQ